MSAFVGVEQLYDALDERTLEILERHRRPGALRRRGSLVRRALAGADVVGLSLAFVIAEAVYSTRVTGGGALGSGLEIAAFAASLPGWVVAAKVYGLYDKDEERTDHSTADDFIGVFHLITVGTWLLYASSLLSAWFRPEFGKLFLFWLLATAGVPVARAVARAYCRRQVTYLQNAIIVGAGDVGQTIARKLLNHPEYGINLVGLVDANPKERLPGLDHLTLLGDIENLPELVRLLDVERVILAFSGDSHDELLALIEDLGDLDVQIDIIPRLFEALGPRVSVHTLEGVALLSLPPLRLTASALYLKRLSDIALALVGIVCAAPVMVAVGLVVCLDSRGPMLYRSQRVGRRGKRFDALKFRTMCDGSTGSLADLKSLLEDPARREEFERTHKLADDPRITRVGRWLRRTSLDELPQLWNILRGDISLVGPRPITSDEFELLGGDGYWSRSDLRPGLTGYWQINGRSATDYTDRTRLDNAYLNGWSLGLDLAIVAKTFRVLVARRGAY